MRRDGRRLIELDVLRGVAALAVVLYHFTFRYVQLYAPETTPFFQLTHGNVGVQLFFGISGFVIFMTLERTQRPMDFVVSRFSRLWPAYVFAGAITFTAVSLFGLPGREVTPLQAVINLTMFQDLLRVPHIDPAYWSLQVELIFYVWMFLAYRCGLLPRILPLLWLALVPVAIWGLFPSMSYLLGTLLLVKYAPFFVIGIAAYRIQQRGRILASDIAIIGAAVATAILWLPREDGVTACAAAVIFIALSLEKLQWTSRGPLLFLGAISYTWYLVHQNIGYIVIRAATARHVNIDVAIGIALLLSVLVAYALTRLVERPAQRWIRERYRALNPSAPSIKLAQ